MTKRPEGATVQVGLRIKEGLRARLQEEAQERGLSLNAEITRRLEASLIQEDASERIERRLEDRFQSAMRAQEILLRRFSDLQDMLEEQRLLQSGEDRSMAKVKSYLSRRAISGDAEASRHLRAFDEEKSGGAEVAPEPQEPIHGVSARLSPEQSARPFEPVLGDDLEKYLIGLLGVDWNAERVLANYYRNRAEAGNQRAEEAAELLKQWGREMFWLGRWSRFLERQEKAAKDGDLAAIAIMPLLQGPFEKVWQRAVKQAEEGVATAELAVEKMVEEGFERHPALEGSRNE